MLRRRSRGSNGTQVAQIHNDKQVYALLGRLFEGVVADDEVGARMQRIDAVVQQQFRRPDATITMKLVAGEDRAVVTGKTDLRPGVVLVMDAVTGHRVWGGELSAMAALSKGQIRARGPVAKILQLIDAIALVAPRYRAQLDGLASGAAASGDEAASEAAAAAEGAAAGEVVAEDAAEEAAAQEEAAEEVASAEASAEEAPSEEAPAEEAPAEEAPAEEAPAEEAPAEEAPAEEAPAEEPAAEEDAPQSGGDAPPAADD